MTNIFDIRLVFSRIPKILTALPVTLEITVFTMIISLILGLGVAMVKIKQVPVLRRITGFLVSFLRGTPILVQLYLTYYGIPVALKYINYYNGTSFNINNVPSMVFVLLAFSLNETAYSSEIIRAAIQSVSAGQLEAAHSLGMTNWQVLRRVMIPEAFVVALPSLGNSLLGLMKGTSLAFVCAVVDLTAKGRILAGGDYRYFEMYISLSIIYWVMTILVENGIKLIEKHQRIPESPDATEDLSAVGGAA